MNIIFVIKFGVSIVNGAVGNLNGFKPNERVVKCSEVSLTEV